MRNILLNKRATFHIPADKQRPADKHYPLACIVGMALIFLTIGLGACRPATPTADPVTTVPSFQASTTPAVAPETLASATLTPSSRTNDDQPSHDAWLALDTTGGGGQTGIATHPTDPNIVYMASDNGGLLKTENAGLTWFSASSNLGAYQLGSVTLDPLNPDVVYVTAATDHGKFALGGSTGELYRSLNGGDSWQFLATASEQTASAGFHSSFPNQAAIAIPYDPADSGRFDSDGDRLSDVLLIGAWSGPADPAVGGVWRSQDEGQTFVRLALGDRNITALRVFKQDTATLFLTTYEGEIYRSQDMGETWRDITGNLPLAHLADVAIHPTDEDTLYVTCWLCQPGKPPVWKTDDGGQSWKQASRGLDSTKSSGFPNILIDRFDPETLYVTTFQSGRGVYMSTNGGRRWRLMPARMVLPDGRPYHLQRFSGGLTLGQGIDGRLYAGGGGGWRYPAGPLPGQDRTRGRKEWEPATIGVGNIHVNTIKVDPLDPTVLYQGISDRGPYKSIDRGASFHRIVGTGWPVTVDNFVWNGPYYSSYEQCKLDCSSTCTASAKIASGGTTDFAISKQNEGIVYSSFGSGSNKSLQGGVNKSTDGGKTWQPVGFQLEKGFDLNPETCVPYGFRHLAIDPLNDNIVFTAMENQDALTGKLYRTTDGGATWSEVFGTAGYVTGLEISPLDPRLVVLTTWTQVLKSDRGGEADSWQDITPDQATGIQTIALSPHQAQVFVIGTRNQGIHYTADGGANWTNNPLQGFFEQKVSQDSDLDLDPTIATAYNPQVETRRDIRAIAFDPTERDRFYVGGSQGTRASFGVATVTDAGQSWDRLTLAGLTHRNVYDLAVDSWGEFLYAGTNDGTFRFKLR